MTMTARGERAALMTDQLGTLRQRVLIGMTAFGIPAALITLIFRIFIGASDLAGFFATTGALALLVAVALLALRGYLQFATNIMLALFMLALVLLPTRDAVMGFGIFIVVASATLARPVVYVLSTGLTLAWTGYLAFTTPATNGSAGPNGEFISLFIIFFFLSGAIRYLIAQMELTAYKASRSARLLQSTAEVGQVLSQVLNMDDLLRQAVELIRDRFAFYHVQVFLVDEAREYANLVASTGDVGQRLIERQHRLPVGSQSVIGRVAQVGEAVISRDTDTDSVHAVNELLPNTRSELALPILDGERIVGALDVQSTRRNAFLDEDIQALQVMANQLATAMRNATLFENIQASLRENKRLFLEAEANLRENQRLNSQFAATAWANYLATAKGVSAITLDQGYGVPQFEADWSEAMREAQRRVRPITRNQDGQQMTAVPIVLRGAVIGAIEVAAQDVRETDMIEMMNAIAQRLATNLDNVRLYEEAQEATLQEQKINTVVARYQAASSVDEMLQITLSELSEALGAEQGTIRLGLVSGTPSEPAPASSANGHHGRAGHNGASAHYGAADRSDGAQGGDW
jgi:GAF domain-containing protein